MVRQLASASTRQRLRIEIQGAVQGVGFRPFVYRLASDLALTGWVINDTRGVFIEAEGSQASLTEFLERLSQEKPQHALVHNLDAAWLQPVGYQQFEIRHSQVQGAKTVLVLPDIATCADCLAEILDPADQRPRYPFTNCTSCGPRFTIVQALPYDRPNTTMRGFRMCLDCRAEYQDPLDRRFHAQPNACPVCGPQLALWASDGQHLESGDDALRHAARALSDGRIVAVKGLGGFHLMVDAGNDEAVDRLRDRKSRPNKPLALMARDLAQAHTLCEIPPEAEALLTSAQAPIVLLSRKPQATVAASVAPGNPYLGIMLPYTPLHHLLMQETRYPVVATSGNLTDEPICTDEMEAIQRLGHVADLFLVHNRAIARHADDSIAWVVRGGPRLLRRARGYAPLPVLLRQSVPTILGVGAHLKNSVALSVGKQVFISQHIGDLETAEALNAFERVIADFEHLYEVKPVAIAHDLHPDYLSTHWAQRQGVDSSAADPALISVQHHHAHLAACLAENGARGPALGVTWDGTGYGSDGTVWGGEFLLGDAADFSRVACLLPFRLPGGDAAVKEPRRTALALLWEIAGEAIWEREDLAPVGALGADERRLMTQMLSRGINSPLTTSAGRLFDAVAALLDLCQQITFEGQAAMALEFAADGAVSDAYHLPLVAADALETGGMGHWATAWARRSDLLVLDWRPMVEDLLTDLQQQLPAGIIAARFHNAMVEAIVAVAHRVGERRVALSGGCFQNRWLTERSAQRLSDAGFEVLLHSQVPPNDGCISLGQVAVAAARMGR